jgi:outer membrane receptor protein involved in Fe transport
VVDVQGSYQARDDLGISIGVDNLFDETTPVNFSTVGAIEDPPGAFAYVTLRWTR